MDGEKKEQPKKATRSSRSRSGSSKRKSQRKDAQARKSGHDKLQILPGKPAAGNKDKVDCSSQYSRILYSDKLKKNIVNTGSVPAWVDRVSGSFLFEKKTHQPLTSATSQSRSSFRQQNDTKVNTVSSPAPIFDQGSSGTSRSSRSSKRLYSHTSESSKRLYSHTSESKDSAQPSVADKNMIVSDAKTSISLNRSSKACTKVKSAELEDGEIVDQAVSGGKRNTRKRRNSKKQIRGSAAENLPKRALRKDEEISQHNETVSWQEREDRGCTLFQKQGQINNNSQRGEIKYNSQRVAIKNDSRCGAINNDSRCGAINNDSRRGAINNDSKVENSCSTSSVHQFVNKVNIKSRLGAENSKTFHIDAGEGSLLQNFVELKQRSQTLSQAQQSPIFLEDGELLSDSSASNDVCKKKALPSTNSDMSLSSEDDAAGMIEYEDSSVLMVVRQVSDKNGKDASLGSISYPNLGMPAGNSQPVPFNMTHIKPFTSAALGVIPPSLCRLNPSAPIFTPNRSSLALAEASIDAHIHNSSTGSSLASVLQPNAWVSADQGSKSWSSFNTQPAAFNPEVFSAFPVGNIPNMLSSKPEGITSHPHGLTSSEIHTATSRPFCLPTSNMPTTQPHFTGALNVWPPLSSSSSSSYPPWMPGPKVWTTSGYQNPVCHVQTNSAMPCRESSSQASTIRAQLNLSGDQTCPEMNSTPRCWDRVQEVKAGAGSLEFTVMSYNILSQELLEQHMCLYETCLEQDLEWESRGAALIRQIAAHNADIVCLQEVQQEHWFQDIRSNLSGQGYRGVYKKAGATKPDGCAILYKSSKFKQLKVVPVEFKKGGIMDRENIGLILLLQPRQEVYGGSTKKICVATTHLLFNPRRGDVKLAQLMLFLAEIDKHAYNGGVSERECAGDVSSGEGSSPGSVNKDGGGFSRNTDNLSRNACRFDDRNSENLNRNIDNGGRITDNISEDVDNMRRNDDKSNRNTDTSIRNDDKLNRNTDSINRNTDISNRITETLSRYDDKLNRNTDISNRITDSINRNTDFVSKYPEKEDTCNKEGAKIESPGETDKDASPKQGRASDSNNILDSQESNMYPGGQHHYHPIIMCGDFNSEPFSDLYKFVTTGHLKYENLIARLVCGQQEGTYGGTNKKVGRYLLPEHLSICETCQYTQVLKERFHCDKRSGSNHCLRLNSGQAFHNMNFHSVYSHFVDPVNQREREISTHHSRCSCTVDYIFYSKCRTQKNQRVGEEGSDGKSEIATSLAASDQSKRDETSSSMNSDSTVCNTEVVELLARYKLLTTRELAKTGFMPNSIFPSDHLCLIARFLLH